MNKKAIALASVLAFGALVGTNEYFSTQGGGTVSEQLKDSVQSISEFKESVHYKVVDAKSIRETLSKLEIGQNESFEIFSYSCPACMMFEPILDNLSLETGANIHKVQLGFNNFPIAEVDYIIAKSLEGDNLKKARSDLYALMTNSGMNFEKKVEALEVFPASRAITPEETKHLTSGANDYRDLTRKLAVDLDISGTPTLVLFGKYEVLRENLKTSTDLIALYKHLEGLSDSSQVEAESIKSKP